MLRRHESQDVDLYSGEEVVKLLIGNKDDNDQKVVDTDAAREFAKDHNMLFMEVRCSCTHAAAALRSCPDLPEIPELSGSPDLPRSPRCAIRWRTPLHGAPITPSLPSPLTAPIHVASTWHPRGLTLATLTRRLPRCAR